MITGTGTSTAVLAAVPISWPTFVKRLGLRPPTLFTEMGIEDTNVAELKAAEAVQSGSAAIPAAACRHMSPEATAARVAAAVAGVLGAPIGPDEPLMAAGLDSLGAVELRNTLESVTGLQLPGTLVFDYPSTAAITDLVINMSCPAQQEMINPSAPEGVDGLARDGPVERITAERATQLVELPQSGLEMAAHQQHALVGVFGSACRSPAGLLQAAPAGDAIQSVPAERWDLEWLMGLKGSSGPGPPRFGGWLEDIAYFDAKAFGVADGEAYLMDPQQRLLLEISHEALQAAGGTCSSSTCIAVGIASAEYSNQVVARHTPGESSYSATGAALSVASGRLAFTYGFKGATFSVDTACSSSLVGAHLARAGLQTGASSAGLACGVGLILSPTSTAMFQKAGMLAVDGRCKTLDTSADGYVRSEAAGAMIIGLLGRTQQPTSSGHPAWESSPLDRNGLQQVDAAVQDVQAVMMLAGSAVNQDGRSSGLTAPHGPSQQEVIRAALASCRRQVGCCQEIANVFIMLMNGSGGHQEHAVEVCKACS